MKKRTKKAYLDLYDNPFALFGRDEETGRGAKVLLYPNGCREIWIQNANGSKSFSIVASEGPAGFSLTIKPAVGTPDATLLGAISPDYKPVNVDGLRDISICQYNSDYRSQLFKRWYMADSKDMETRLALRAELDEIDKKAS